MILLTSQLDYETSKHYSYDVKAKFNDGMTSYVRITVNVVDVNDICPVFSQSTYFVQHTEPIQQNLIVASTMVTDGDTTGTLTYTIQSGDNRFGIKSDGKVYTKTVIDNQTSTASTTTVLKVSVSDGICSREADVQITLNKVVVRSYLFKQPLYQYLIDENVSVPRVVGTIANSQHTATYSIVGGNAYFTINATTGS